MTFEELLDQAMAMLERRGRVTYRALKRQFQLDDDVFEDLTVEIIKAQRLAVDEDGDVLVWTGTVAGAGRSPAPAQEPVHAPHAYTPLYLAEKILTSKAGHSALSARATCPALPRLERALGICQDADLPFFFPRTAAALGAPYTLAGRVADAIPLVA